MLDFGGLVSLETTKIIFHFFLNISFLLYISTKAYAHIALFVTEKHNMSSLVKIISNLKCERLKLKGFQMEYPKNLGLEVFFFFGYLLLFDFSKDNKFSFIMTNVGVLGLGAHYLYLY